MFLLTFTVVNMAPTRQRLENDVFTVGGIAQKYNCALKRLDWQQEQGVCVLSGAGLQRGGDPAGHDHQLHGDLSFPLMTRELRMGGPALYYGMNALSHNVIMADRKKAEIGQRAVPGLHRLRQELCRQSGSSSMCSWRFQRTGSSWWTRWANMRRWCGGWAGRWWRSPPDSPQPYQPYGHPA